jgi:hypothetical protein
MSQESTFEGLATLLQGKFIVQHGSNVGKRDPAHNVLAMVIIYQCGMDGFLNRKQIKAVIQVTGLTASKS